MISQGIKVLDQTNIEYLEKILLDDWGRLQPVPFASIKDAPQNDISVFCHKQGIYQIVTTELVEFIGGQIKDFDRPIEIGSGNGCLGRALSIPMTDSFIQNTGEMKNFYRSIGQPVVRYGADVRRLDALKAVKLLKADAAVGAWVTHKKKPHLRDGLYCGVDEAILSKRLKRYVFVGNRSVHRHKELLRYCQPKEYRFDWLVSRSVHRAENLIWVFDF